MIVCGNEAPKLTVCRRPVFREEWVGRGGLVPLGARSRTKRTGRRRSVVQNGAERCRPGLSTARLSSARRRSFRSPLRWPERVDRKVCVGLFRRTSGVLGLGTGPVNADGTCKMEDIDQDHCILNYAQKDDRYLERYPDEIAALASPAEGSTFPTHSSALKPSAPPKAKAMNRSGNRDCLLRYPPRRAHSPQVNGRIRGHGAISRHGHGLFVRRKIRPGPHPLRK